MHVVGAMSGALRAGLSLNASDRCDQWHADGGARRRSRCRWETARAVQPTALLIVVCGAKRSPGSDRSSP